MDYEKKYKEALERAKEQYNYPTMSSCMSILEEIFPELKESEDKRIRKALIRVLYENVGNGIEKYGAKLEDALAWIEKQDEQTPAWSEEDKKYLRRAINATRNGYPETNNWLKSLKERYTWKPSDEQIELLEALVEDNNQRYFYTTLNSLYEQLKKLKGE